jgi:protein AbiQ
MVKRNAAPKDLSLVYVDDRFTKFLQEHGDSRVSKNSNIDYQRPFIGVLFRIEEFLYFAPLTTSSKGRKLQEHPKSENITFYPIENCKYGGINFNNMIPLVDGVYKEIDMVLRADDFGWERNKKIQLMNIKRILRHEGKYLISKAVNLYSLKTKGTLYPNYDKITCDFKKLEKIALQWKTSGKGLSVVL